MKGQFGTLAINPLDISSGLLDLLRCLLFGLSEMELSLHVLLVASLELGVIVPAEEGVLHASASMDLGKSKRSRLTSLMIVTIDHSVSNRVASNKLLVLNIGSLLLLLEDRTCWLPLKD